MFDRRLIPLLLLFLCFAPAKGQDRDALTARLLEAQSNTSIDDPVLKPWHLVLAVQLFDPYGKPAEQGTVEEWWAGPKRAKTTYSFPSYTATELRTEAGAFRTKSASAPPFQAEALMEQVTHPIATESYAAQTTPVLRQQSFGTVALDCIAINQPGRNVEPPVAVETYCFNPGTSILRVSSDTEFLTLRNALGKFQGRNVGTDISTNVGNVKLWSGHVTALSTLADEDASLFTPTADLEALPVQTVYAGAPVIAGTRLSGMTPTYPYNAKARHLSGTVILRGVISTEGKIVSVTPIFSSDLVFTGAAIAAVRTWTYKPYLLNGQPTQVNTMITTHFNISN